VRRRLHRDIKGRKSHKIVEDAIAILCNLEHRGAVGADPRAGDGAGILVQTPHKFFQRKAGELGIKLPQPGHYAVGSVFMPHDPEWRKVIQDVTPRRSARGAHPARLARGAARQFLARESVKPTEPFHMQVFIGRGPSITSEDDFERKLYILRKVISDVTYRKRDRRLAGYYVVSLSCRTLIYKGMFLADQLGKYYPDLHEPDFETALALVHQRSRPHVPELAAGAPVPHGRAQWRDQHAAWQRQLDGGAAGFGVVEALRRRHQEALADLV